MVFKVLYDEPQEADWFKALHPDLVNAAEIPISEAARWPSMTGVLGYDRPDIVLLADDLPILVVEETVEVPSGHNVGQRFARLAAAAEHHVPCLYFGPYVARKHGGETAGPRYMNLRLFAAIDAMVRVTGTAVTTINWPVDERCEVRRDPDKDRDVREYLRALLDTFNNLNPAELSRALLESPVHRRMVEDRNDFVRGIKRQQQYDLPPDSVQVLDEETFVKAYKTQPSTAGVKAREIVLYKVGMKNIRSDPYTGMAMLYHYLYIAEHPGRALILWFPEITLEMWRRAASRPTRKDVRLYRHASEAILFRDGLVAKADL